MANRDGKDLLSKLDSEKQLEYGAVILGEDVRNHLDLPLPSIEGKTIQQVKRELDSVALMEMAAIDYVRNVLLGRGMYIKNDNGNYRILLPSENKVQIEAYVSSADRKLSRALKLSRNTPTVDNIVRDNCIETRISMKKNNLRYASGSLRVK
jgi:hypothetical protein